MRYKEITEARGKLRPTPEDIQKIKHIRHEVRCAEGGGGMCHWVSEIIHNKFGWEQGGGTVCNDADEPICVTHRWNILPDGAILDSTADQLGIGHDIRIIEPTDPDFKKYRLEWDSDYNPKLHKDYPELKGVPWSGKYDFEWADEIRDQRGRDWHVTDKAQYDEYLRRDKAYTQGKVDPKKPFGDYPRST